MGFIKDLFSPNKYYKQFEQLGISKDEAIELDKLDGKKDKKLNGKSLFDAVKEYKEAYDKQPLLKELNQDITLFKYIKSRISMISAFKMLGEVEVFGSYTADDIAEQLMDENADFGKTMKKINGDNVVEVLQKYKEASDKKHTFLGIKYDNETLIESILEAKIPEETKKEYLLQIKNALVERIENLTGDAGHISKLFEAAIDSTLAKGSRAKSKALDKLITKFLEIINQLESMDAKNQASETQPIDAILRVPEMAEPLKNVADILGISLEEFFGNGYFDGNAIQMDGNCWAHGCLNNMLLTDAGKQYINNLIVRTNDTTSVYLPGAKDEGLPPPKGDGIFTYDNINLYVRAGSESIGDGDYTAFMMAITDYRKMSKVHPGNSSEGGGDQFNYLIFGKDYDNDNSTVISTTNPKIQQLSEEVAKFPLRGGMTKEKKQIIKDFFGDHDAKTRYEKFKELFNRQQGYFSIIISDKNTTAKAKKVDTGEEIQLLGEHAYSLAEVKENSVILKESNNPTQELEVDYETFMTLFNISYNKFPDSML